MVEFVAKDFIAKNNINNIEVISAGTSNYHEGEFMHHGTDELLKMKKIIHEPFHSQPLTQTICDECNWIIVMDQNNYIDVLNNFSNVKDKLAKLTDFGSLGYKNVPDPWYTNDFNETYLIIIDALKPLFKYIIDHNNI